MGLLTTLLRSLDDLVAQGYPREVAERIVSGELPMDFESRMARASDQGYNISDVQYHGTSDDIMAFREGLLGTRDPGFVGKGVYTTPEARLASSYANMAPPRERNIAGDYSSPNVMPLLTRSGEYEQLDLADKINLAAQIKQNPTIASDITKSLSDAGKAGSEVRDVTGALIERATFDPSNVRSYLSAAFDPQYKGPNILGSAAGAAGALGLLSPDDAEAGISKQAAKEFIDGAVGLIDPRYDPRAGSVDRLASLDPGFISRGTTEDVPRIALSSLEGMPFVTTMSDRTRAGGLLSSINDINLDMPVNLQGGQDFMFENPGMTWASAPGVVSQIIKTANAAGDNPLYMPFRMAPTGGDFATKTGETLISYASSAMSKADKKALDKAIKDYTTVGKMVKDKNTGLSKRVGDGLSIKGWKGVDNPESIEVWRNTPDAVRKEIMDKVFDKQFRNKGGLSIGEARLAVSDPTQAGAIDAGVQNVGQIFTGQPAITKSGHPSYPSGVPGQGLGRLDDQPMTIFDFIPEARLGEEQRKVSDTVDALNPSARDIRAVTMKPYSGVITEDILRSLENRGINLNDLAPYIGGGTVAAGLASSPDASAMNFYDNEAALKEAGVIGGSDPLRKPLGERAMGVVDRIFRGLEVPQRGVQGLAATGYGLLSGEGFDAAASRGADVVNQGVEESAKQFGDYIFNLTGSPEAATAAYTSGILGSPL